MDLGIKPAQLYVAKLALREGCPTAACAHAPVGTSIHQCAPLPTRVLVTDVSADRNPMVDADGSLGVRVCAMLYMHTCKGETRGWENGPPSKKDRKPATCAAWSDSNWETRPLERDSPLSTWLGRKVFRSSERIGSNRGYRRAAHVVAGLSNALRRGPAVRICS